VKRRWISVGGLLLAVLLLTVVVSHAASGSTLFGTRFKLGETIQFRVEDSTSWWWGCCCCTETLVLGWRIVNTSEQTLYSAAFNAPVSASQWQGSWNQVDANSAAVSAGQYKLYVDTSVGTLSRCFTIYDPCCRCGWSPCSVCSCEQVTSISDCACRTTLVFIDTCQTGCFPFFGWGGGWCSSCCGCSSCP